MKDVKIVKMNINFFYIIFLINSFIIINFINGKEYSNSDEISNFNNEPDVLNPVYHHFNDFESESYKYWKENKPISHYHNSKPSNGRLHQHFERYGEAEQYKNFITGYFSIVKIIYKF